MGTVKIGFSESTLDRRERLLAEKAKRDEKRRQDERELNAWKWWVNQTSQVVV